ncbi:hypothetical protein KP509_15G044100 [Ceratopteris richardii]|uniref:cysteine dioxygenase n=1 Tax=Ceratopteris richardii TaxID=49495 RepID=A0A8T2T794_CERRI|nr:hypothetical protein KP509_15G044100 [Ceratopteris richardii]
MEQIGKIVAHGAHDGNCHTSRTLYLFLFQMWMLADKPWSFNKISQRWCIFCNNFTTFARRRFPHSSPELQHRIKSLIDTVTLIDFGLDEESFVQLNKYLRFPKKVFYLHVYKCHSFSIGIFYLPQSAVIPLHDHPDMTVFGKLLFGSVHVKGYDWVDSANLKQRQDAPLRSRLAKLSVEEIFTAPCKSYSLHPTCGGNIHTLTGVTHCAILDVIVPPYSKAEGRRCTYYRESPFIRLSSNVPIFGECSSWNLAWLEEDKSPDESIIQPLPYRPPQIAF